MVLPALGVETGVEPPRRSGGRLARFGRSATAAATGDPFRDLASGGALAEPFVLVRRLRMLEGVSRGDGRNADEPEKTDRARKGDGRHGGDDNGRGGGEYLRRCNGDCADVRGMPST